MPAANHLIDLLPTKDRRRLLAACQPTELVLADVLYEKAAVTRYAYFPTEGFISLVAMTEGHAGVEVGMVGREGMLGTHLALGVETAPLHALVQGAGAALRIDRRAFRAQLALSAPLRNALNRYVAVLMAQMATSAVCLRFHQIGPRLARWLLMSQDRAGADTFHVTQEFLAYMLGVRRVGVTGAASALQAAGSIAYRRGVLTVLDRARLERAACSCYALDRRAYAEQMR